MRRRLILLIQAAISAGLVYWVISLMPIGSWSRLLDIHKGWLAATLGLFFIAQCLCAMRLFLLVRNSLPWLNYGVLLQGTLLGYFYSSFLPATIGGDVIKLAWLARKAPRQSHALLSAMILERIVSLMVGILTVLLALVFVPSLWDSIALINEERASLFVFITVAILVIIAASIALARRYRLDSLGVLRSSHVLKKITAAFSAGIGKPTALAGAAVISLIIYVVIATSLVILLCGLGQDLGLIQSLFVTGFITIIGLFPLSINGIGVQEAGISGLLVYFGCDAEVAAQAAILQRLIALATALPGGFWLLENRGSKRQHKEAEAGDAYH